MSLFTPSLMQATDANGNPDASAQWHFYLSDGTTDATVYADAAMSTPLANPVIADAAGRFAPIFLDATVAARAVFKSSAGTAIFDIDPFDLPSGAQGAFSQSAAYAAGTVGKALQQRSVAVTDAPYSADNTGVTDSAAAFNSAAAAANHIIVPAGTYKLGTVPTWTGSKYWDIDPAAVFTGAGSGASNFPYMNANTAQLAVGPYIKSQSSQKSTDSNGGIAAFNVEMLQPSDYGAGQSVAIFAGARISCANSAANGWAANFVGAVDSTALGTMSVLEIDADTNSASATVKGLAITGGGSANADVAIEITRAAMAWDLGVSIADATIGLIMTGLAASGVGIVVHAPDAQVAISAGEVLAARQFWNGADTILLQRYTDTAPSGYFMRAVNAANNANLMILDYAGDLTLAGQLTQTPPASATPAANGQMTFQLTSNTQLTVKVKGSDGTVRSNTLTLA